MPSDYKIKIVWHYSGKLYVGEWNEPNNEKSGEGI